MRYEEIQPITKEKAEEFFKSGSEEDICNAMVSIAFCESDWRWAQDKFIDLFINQNIRISCLAATCLGHIARVHQKLDKTKVIAALNSRKEKEIAGCVDDAKDDIAVFIADA